MASTIYIKIQGNGNVTTTGYEGYTQVKSVDFSASAYDMNATGSTQRGSLNLSRVKVTNSVDSSFIYNLGHLHTNAQCDIDIKFTRSYGEKTKDFLIFELRHCSITDVNFSIDDNGDPIETFSISYQEGHFIANDFDATGNPLAGGISQTLSRPRGV